LTTTHGSGTERTSSQALYRPGFALPGALTKQRPARRGDRHLGVCAVFPPVLFLYLSTIGMPPHCASVIRAMRENSTSSKNQRAAGKHRLRFSSTSYAPSTSFASSAPFLIDIWRLEIAATHSKQTARAHSNRHVCGAFVEIQHIGAANRYDSMRFDTSQGRCYLAGRNLFCAVRS
jgi:hypothetical protein